MLCSSQPRQRFTDGEHNAELKNIIEREGKASKTGYEEEKSAKVAVAVASGELSHKGQFQIGQKEPFEAVLESLRQLAGSQPAVLVFDNLEAAFKQPFLTELADLLILCDDARYATYNVRIVIVGVPSGLREYYYRTPHHATVANRLYEIPEVFRLSPEGCRALVERGLIGQLSYTVPELDKVANHIAWITDRVPQMVHEYCLELSLIAERKEKTVSSEMLNLADMTWISKSLYHAYSVIEGNMNERDTKAGRRNQTLYALSKCDGEHFKAQDVENLVRSEFPASTANTALNLPQMMGILSGGDKPLLRRSPKGDAFQFADPRYRMVLRAMLVKATDGRVTKIPLSRG